MNTIGSGVTKEDFSRNVKVPARVEQDLKRIISDRLEQCGIYYRVFSRIKTAASLARKFELKEYNDSRKLQDLVGVRINLYFDDDVEICRSIMEKTFEVIEWSASERGEDEFRPTKLTGVFRLPEYLKAQISPTTWEMFIDDTFEIQIKTIFFEGWHEIEHDMRYKGEEVWGEYPGFSRYFNSILATLELCDKSIVRLFDDLGHEMYKTGQWTHMIRSHFRVKLDDVFLYPEVEKILTEDQKISVDSLAKRIYKTPRAKLVELLLRRVRRIPINVNTIVALLNDNIFHDSELTEVFRSRDVYNDGREESVVQARRRIMPALERHCVFRIKTGLDGSRMREEGIPEPEEIFAGAAVQMWRWAEARFGELFENLPPSPTTWQGDVLGYHMRAFYDPQHLRMKMDVHRIDQDAGGRIWYTEGELRQGETGRIMVEICNGYAEPPSEHAVEATASMLFSYPGYYKLLTDNIGIYNGIECSSRRRILRTDDLDRVREALEDPGRVFPIVLIISKETPEGMMDEGWLDQFRVSDFTRTVWRYAHVFTCYEETGRKLLSDMRGWNGYREEVPGLYIFWPGSEMDVYRPQDVENCSFGRHLEARGDARTYDIVHGGQAFYHKIVTDLRDYNVSAQY